VSSDDRRIAWVTGGSRGIGADTAIRLAESGYDVAITARDQAKLEAVATEIERLGRHALAMASDLTERHSVVEFASAAEAWGGRCDVLLNNGYYQGAGAKQLLVDMPIDELATSLEADVVAPALLCQRAVQMMLKHDGGVIVNMSSAVVFLDPSRTVANGGWSLAYAAGKAGLDQFAKVINAECGSAGIRAFTVEPGFVAYGDEFKRALDSGEGAPVNPTEAIGAAILWLVQSREASRLLSKRIHLPSITEKYGLLPGWAGSGSAFSTRW
jgi:NAD(P)-dependent dehydrogenase (short-subunit alcohol dehydrogenase family)